MKNSNGGEFITDKAEFERFPKNKIAIGSDRFGNRLLLMHSEDGVLDSTIHFWNHENGKTEIIANSIREKENMYYKS